MAASEIIGILLLAFVLLFLVSCVMFWVNPNSKFYLKVTLWAAIVMWIATIGLFVALKFEGVLFKDIDITSFF